MPIQIALANPAPDATLELREVQPMRDGDFAAFLLVRSGAFAAALPFFFTRGALHDFLGPLATLVAGGAGAATLASMEASFIALHAGPANTLVVKGTLREANPEQSLEFAFAVATADAEPLLDGLRQLAEPTSSSA
jgi:hypothetical protein